MTRQDTAALHPPSSEDTSGCSFCSMSVCSAAVCLLVLLGAAVASGAPRQHVSRTLTDTQELIADELVSPPVASRRARFYILRCFTSSYFNVRSFDFNSETCFFKIR